MALMAGKSITKGDIIKMQKRITSLQSRAKNAMAQAEGIMESVVTTVEVGSSAFALGVVHGRYGPRDIMGIPLDLATAVGLHGLALLGVGGEMKTHMHAFGNGALASYLNTVGRGLGVSMAREGEPAESSGDIRGTDELTNQQLSDL